MNQIYIYFCNSCKCGFEIQRDSEDCSVTKCPNCGSESTRRVYQALAVHCKGEGFYSNDSKKLTAEVKS
jgi:putative FmdB family regulatory protein